MSWDGLASVVWPAAQECLKAEIDVAHSENSLDGAFAEFAGQRENLFG